MRLVGATPRQTSVIAAVESAVAAAAGIVIGFGLFFVLRIPLAAIPFTGQSFFPAELSLSLPDILAVAVGVPAASALAARLALRRVNISPLGVSRRVTPGSLRAWRVLPLLAGLAELGFVVVHGKPASPGGKVLVYVPGFALIMIGLILAGPWLTMAGARVMARRASRPGTLIAARRLADDPRAAFRAVSGVVLALFIFTVAAALLATQNTKHFTLKGDAAANNTLLDEFSTVNEVSPGNQVAVGSVPPPAATALARLRRISGVQGIVEFRADPRLQVQGSPGALVSCAQLASAPGIGRCPAGAATAEVRGVRAAYRPRRLSPRADRRRDRRMTSRLPGGKVDVLAGRDRGQRREPAQVGAADVKPAELDALDQGVPSLRPQRQHTEADLHGDDVDQVVPFRLGAEQPDQPAGAGLELGELHDDGVGLGVRSQITPGDHDDIAPVGRDPRAHDGTGGDHAARDDHQSPPPGCRLARRCRAAGFPAARP